MCRTLLTHHTHAHGHIRTQQTSRTPYTPLHAHLCQPMTRARIYHHQMKTNCMHRFIPSNDDDDDGGGSTYPQKADSSNRGRRQDESRNMSGQAARNLSRNYSDESDPRDQIDESMASLSGKQSRNLSRNFPDDLNGSGSFHMRDYNERLGLAHTRVPSRGARYFWHLLFSAVYGATLTRLTGVHLAAEVRNGVAKIKVPPPRKRCIRC